MKKNFVCFIVIYFAGLSLVVAQRSTEIYWKSWSELENAIKENPKPVFMFFHAKWCAYCKKIDREVFTKQEVIQKLNTDYYAIEMDVESTDTIYFEGVEFTNKQALTKRNGIHEIPLLLASREGIPFSLPATVLLNKDFTLKDRFFEYYTAKQLLKNL